MKHLLVTSILVCWLPFNGAIEHSQHFLRGAGNIGDTSEARFRDPKTIAHKFDEASTIVATADRQLSRRKFVSYTSSYVERLWLEHVDQWTDEKLICDVLLDQQSSFIHDWLNLTCTQRYMAPYQWCKIDDNIHPLWYHWGNRDEFE
jgi:hypothetical protein